MSELCIGALLDPAAQPRKSRKKATVSVGPEYRKATMEEREVINSAGQTCWLVRDYGDVVRSCPNPRLESGFCEHHEKRGWR